MLKKELWKEFLAKKARTHKKLNYGRRPLFVYEVKKSQPKYIGKLREIKKILD